MCHINCQHSDYAFCLFTQAWHLTTNYSTLTSLHTHAHTCLTALCPGLPGWACTRKVKPIWILLKQETVSGSGISWAICKSAPRSRQITTPATHHSVIYRPDALPAAKPTASKHWRDWTVTWLQYRTVDRQSTACEWSWREPDVAALRLSTGGSQRRREAAGRRLGWAGLRWVGTYSAAAETQRDWPQMMSDDVRSWLSVVGEPVTI